MSARVFFYVQHLLGVGHVKRAAVIARHLSSTGLRVDVVLGGPPVALADFGNASLHLLPAARAADAGFSAILDEDGQPIDDAWRHNRKDRLLRLFHDLAPDFLMIELYPFGRRQFRFELLPLLEAAHGRMPVACSVRDVLVSKARPERDREIVDVARRFFDRILVHGVENVIPFSATFPAACDLADLVAYTGYVVDDAEANQHVPAPKGKGEVVVSIGGGAVGGDLMRAAMEAARGGFLGDRQWRLLAGDNLAADDFEALRRASPKNVTVERARPDFRALLGGAALSISQGGYNTVMDVLAAGCPALVVPFAEGTESEQTFRAREFERRGLLTMLDADALSPDTLARAAEAAMNRRAGPASALDMGGAEETARLVLRMMEGSGNRLRP